MNRPNNLRYRLEVATFDSDFDTTSMENTLIDKYSSKEELELLFNFEKEAIEAVKEFDGYRSYLLAKASQTDELYNHAGYKR